MNRVTGHKAFTLAEILIVIGIIGIIANITIPTLIRDISDKQLKVAWKKIYAELSQANQMIIADNGSGDFAGQCNDWDDKCLRDLFANKISILKKCDAPVADGCVVSHSKFMDGSTTGFTDINFDWPGLLTNNGYSIKFRYHTKACDFQYPRECGWIQVDVNGLKQPNTVGKDIFFINITRNNLLPVGVQGDQISPDTDCLPTGSGVSCSAKYLME